MTYSEHEQRLLDRQAVRSEILREHRRLMQSENLGPADELGLLRDEMKRLEAREKELRAVLLNEPEARHGKRYVVTVLQSKRTRLDTETLRLDYPNIYEEVTVPYEVTTLKLSGVTEDGEAVSLHELRRITKAQELS